MDLHTYLESTEKYILAMLEDADAHYARFTREGRLQRARDWQIRRNVWLCNLQAFRARRPDTTITSPPATLVELIERTLTDALFLQGSQAVFTRIARMIEQGMAELPTEKQPQPFVPRRGGDALLAYGHTWNTKPCPALPETCTSEACEDHWVARRIREQRARMEGRAWPPCSVSRQCAKADGHEGRHVTLGTAQPYSTTEEFIESPRERLPEAAPYDRSRVCVLDEDHEGDCINDQGQHLSDDGPFLDDSELTDLATRIDLQPEPRVSPMAILEEIVESDPEYLTRPLYIDDSTPPLDREAQRFGMSDTHIHHPACVLDLDHEGTCMREWEAGGPGCVLDLNEPHEKCMVFCSHGPSDWTTRVRGCTVPGCVFEPDHLGMHRGINGGWLFVRPNGEVATQT